MSGVYIKGMEMPTSCGDCKAFVCYRQWAGDAGDCFCGITKNDAKAKEKNADCPLVPVPPHGRLIDADDAIETAWMILRGLGYLKEENPQLEQTVREVFATAPAIEVEDHG